MEPYLQKILVNGRCGPAIVLYDIGHTIIIVIRPPVIDKKVCILSPEEIVKVFGKVDSLTLVDPPSILPRE